jgi:hypothetical protein
MPDSSPTAVVTGAGRGFGRAIATALVAGGVHVVGVARHEDALDAVRDDLGGLFTSVAGYATDDALAHDVIRRYRPGLLVLNAGAAPHMAPVHEQTWESFSRNWNTDTRHAFAWTRAALREPLAPGSVVVAMLSDSWPVTSCATGPVAPGADPRQRAARLRRPAAHGGRARGVRRPGDHADRPADRPHHRVQRPRTGTDVRRRCSRFVLPVTGARRGRRGSRPRRPPRPGARRRRARDP